MERSVDNFERHWKKYIGLNLETLWVWRVRGGVLRTILAPSLTAEKWFVGRYTLSLPSLPPLHPRPEPK